MNRKSIPILLGLLLLGCSCMLAQNFDYVNLRQYRVKSSDDLTAFVKHAYPYFNKSTQIPAVNRLVGNGESGRVYAATYFANLDQFTAFIEEFSTVFEEYSKTPGNLGQKMLDNIEGGIDDVLWKVDKEMSNIPANADVTKMPWRKVYFITVKTGMMAEFNATRKKMMEADKKMGIDYPALYMTVTYGAPNNMVMISLPATNALDFYTAAAARTKTREANAEYQALRKKFASMGSNTLIDQLTMIPY